MNNFVKYVGVVSEVKTKTNRTRRLGLWKTNCFTTITEVDPDDPRMGRKSYWQSLNISGDTYVK